MLLTYLKLAPSQLRGGLFYKQTRTFGLGLKSALQTIKPHELNITNLQHKDDLPSQPIKESEDRVLEIFPTSRVVPMVLSKREHVALPFDDVPGPRSLKLLSNFRSYLSEVGTQITVGALKFGLNIGEH